jgi:hypothetical protein
MYTVWALMTSLRGWGEKKIGAKMTKAKVDGGGGGVNKIAKL